MSSLKNIIKNRSGFDVKYFLANGTWVTSGQIIAMASGMLVSVIFARLQTPLIYGQYQYILAVLGFFSVFSLNGLNLSVMKAVILGQEGSLRQAVRISLYGGIAAIPFLLLFAWYKNTHGDGTVGYVLLWVAWLFPFLYAFNTWSSFYEAKKMYQLVTKRTVAIQLATALAIIIGIWQQLPLVYLVVLFMSVNIAGHYLWYNRALKGVKNNESQLDVRHGVMITIQKFSQTLTGTLPPLLIATFFDYEKVAIFSIAFFLITFVNSVATTMMSVYLPQFFETQRLKVSLSQILIATTGLGALLVAGFTVGTWLFFFRLYGEAYGESYRIVRILIPCILFFPLRSFLGYYLTAVGKNISLIFLNVGSHIIGALLLAVGSGFFSFTSVAASYYIVIALAPLVFNVMQFKRLQQSLP